ncbi:hypothetical protein CANTEDRAFT_117013, partial [Yamadazyma tenuis ATCC 10573]
MRLMAEYMALSVKCCLQRIGLHMLEYFLVNNKLQVILIQHCNYQVMTIFGI